MANSRYLWWKVFAYANILLLWDEDSDVFIHGPLCDGDAGLVRTCTCTDS